MKQLARFFYRLTHDEELRQIAKYVRSANSHHMAKLGAIEALEILCLLYKDKP